MGAGDAYANSRGLTPLLSGSECTSLTRSRRVACRFRFYARCRVCVERKKMPTMFANEQSNNVLDNDNGSLNFDTSLHQCVRIAQQNFLITDFALLSSRDPESSHFVPLFWVFAP